jgi:GDPmannose 4,6-dehydratase
VDSGVSTALITGVLGQDGSLLAELLLDRGYRVVGIARSLARAREDIELRTLVERIELIELDLAEVAGDWATDVLARVQPDEVYHLAACHRSSDPSLRDDPTEHARMDRVNTAAGLALGNALLARGHGRLVFAASSQMYTPAAPPLHVDERTPRAPATYYGITKASCVDGLARLRAERGLAASSAILFNHESPRRPTTFVSRKISLAVARIAAGQQRQLALADLASRVDFSSARDIVEALHAMGQASKGDDFVIASGELVHIEDVCRVAFASVGLDWREHVTSAQVPGERPALVGDPSRAESQLHWQRRHAFADWVAEMVTADQRRIAEGRAPDAR